MLPVVVDPVVITGGRASRRSRSRAVVVDPVVPPPISLGAVVPLPVDPLVVDRSWPGRAVVIPDVVAGRAAAVVVPLPAVDHAWSSRCPGRRSMPRGRAAARGRPLPVVVLPVADRPR